MRGPGYIRYEPAPLLTCAMAWRSRRASGSCSKRQTPCLWLEGRPRAADRHLQLPRDRSRERPCGRKALLCECDRCDRASLWRTARPLPSCPISTRGLGHPLAPGGFSTCDFREGVPGTSFSMYSLRFGTPPTRTTSISIWRAIGSTAWSRDEIGVYVAQPTRLRSNRAASSSRRRFGDNPFPRSPIGRVRRRRPGGRASPSRRLRGGSANLIRDAVWDHALARRRAGRGVRSRPAPVPAESCAPNHRLRLERRPGRGQPTEKNPARAPSSWRLIDTFTMRPHPPRSIIADGGARHQEQPVDVRVDHHAEHVGSDLPEARGLREEALAHVLHATPRHY